MTLLNHYKKEIKEETVDRTNVLGDISYIRGALDNTCQEIKEIGKEARELRDRIIRVEKMIEFAHEKIDERQA